MKQNLKKIVLIDDFSPRLYQQTIFHSCINKNSLVVLPTGLGKTIIALLLSVYYFNKDNKKILFLAPTKPLVEQHLKSFEKFIKNKEELNLTLLTGAVQPKKRVDLYKSSDIIFATPQLIENDLISNILNPEDFSLVIFDEAHRATGNYSYVFIQERFSLKNVKNLSLTASPGSDRETIEEIITNLNIENVEVRDENDVDIKPYIKEKVIEEVKIKFPKEFEEIKNLLNETYNDKKKKIEDIIKYKVGGTKKDLLNLMADLRARIASGETNQTIWKAISLASALLKLQYLLEIFETQEVNVAYNYFKTLYKESSRVKASEELFRSLKFREAFDKISIIYKNGIKHPKVQKLKEIVTSELNKNKDLKIIIFTQYRETASILEEELSSFKELSPVIFVGQQKKNNISMSQKKQKEILDKFREGYYNILISTSIGEEGLDIPNVDLVIFYEPIPSAIRTIQRIGRTGRFSKGKIVMLITEGTRDVAFKYVAKKKEKNMYDILKEYINKIDTTDLNNSIKNNNKKNLLNYFNQTSEEIDSKPSNKNFEKKREIIIDVRENNNLKKELLKYPINLKVESLEVGDILINNELAIERKNTEDFVTSLLNKKIFRQLSLLSQYYKYPLLIIEGEDIYSRRNLNKKIIDSALLSIMINLRVPIFFTKNMEETSYIINLLSEKNNKNNNFKLSKVKPRSEKKELEYFLSNIPNINLSTSKNLLEEFGTIKNIINSSEKELSKTEGIGKVKSKNLVEFFNRDYKNL